MIKINNMKDWIVADSIDISNYKEQVDSLVLNLKQVKENSGLSTHGENSKQYFFDNFDNINNITKNVKELIQSHFKNFSLELLSAWTVYGKKYGYHEIHQHNSENIDHISSVTFLDIPNNIDSELPGDLFFILRNENNELKYLRFKPKIGDIYFFPAHVFHGTFPQSEGNRQTINLDFDVKNFIGGTND